MAVMASSRHSSSVGQCALPSHAGSLNGTLLTSGNQIDSQHLVDLQNRLKIRTPHVASSYVGAPLNFNGSSMVDRMYANTP